MHELGHVIGLGHEQARSDRDEYVTIDFDNIKDGMAHNFKKATAGTAGQAFSPYGNLVPSCLLV